MWSKESAEPGILTFFTTRTQLKRKEQLRLLVALRSQGFIQEEAQPVGSLATAVKAVGRLPTIGCHKAFGITASFRSLQKWTLSLHSAARLSLSVLSGELGFFPMTFPVIGDSKKSSLQRAWALKIGLVPHGQINPSSFPHPTYRFTNFQHDERSIADSRHRPISGTAAVPTSAVGTPTSHRHFRLFCCLLDSSFAQLSIVFAAIPDKRSLATPSGNRGSR